MWSNTTIDVLNSFKNKQHNTIQQKQENKAVKTFAEKGTSVDSVKKLSNEKIGKYECKYETLQENQTANFWVICEKLPVDLKLSKMGFWRDKVLIVRDWKGAIQDLDKKTKI